MNQAIASAEGKHMELTGRQRAQLRGMANTLPCILTVGKEGIGEHLIRQADQALEARELIKGRVLRNNLQYDARSAAAALSAASNSAVVQTIGDCFILYRPSRTRPRDRRICLAPDKKGRGQR